MMQPLLIELGTEELPVKALPGLAQALFDGVIDGLVQRGVAIERGAAAPGPLVEDARAHYREAGLPQAFQILDSQDQHAAVKRVLLS